MIEGPEKNSLSSDDRAWLGLWFKSIDDSLKRISNYVGWLLVIVLLSILASCATGFLSLGR